MGFAKGNLSVIRFRVIGLDGIIQLSSINGKFRENQMPTNWRDMRKSEYFGWVPPLVPGCDEITLSDHWDLSHCTTDGGIALRMRFDRKRVPGEVLKLAVQDKLREYTTKNGKQPSREMRKVIKEETLEDLLMQSLPAISYADALFDDTNSVVYFFNTSKSLTEKFEILFKETFGEALGVRLFKLTPPLNGLRASEWQESDLEKSRFSVIANTTPTLFVENQTL